MGLTSRAARCGCAFIYLIHVTHAALPPLPVWSEEDQVKLKKGEIVAGRALLTTEGEPRSKDDETDLPPEENTERAVEVPEPIVPVPARPDLDPIPLSDDRTEIPKKLLERYFNTTPEPGLIDPQHLLSMQESEDTRFAFREHSEQSPLPIYFYIFDQHQIVPEAYSPQFVYDRLFGASGDPVVIIYYFMGAPSRSQFFLGGQAGGEIPEWQLKELLVNASHTAGEKSEVFDQLDDFVGQLSMRLFWVEKMIEEFMRKNDAAILIDKPVDEAKEDQGKLLGLLSGLGASIAPYFVVLMLGLAVSAGCVAMIVFWWLGRRYEFPVNVGSKARFGASRGAYSGGVLSFRSMEQPPSAQMAQFENDFL